MPETCLSPRISIATISIVFLSLVLSAGANAPTAASASKCPLGSSTGRAACKAAAPRYKTVRHGFLVSVPHTSGAEGTSEVVTVKCPGGGKVLAGGVKIAEPAFPFLTVTLSAPDEAVNGWSAQLTNLSTTADSEAWMSVYAICEVPPRK